MKRGKGNRPAVSYEQVLQELDGLYWHLLSVEATVGAYVNQQGISWARIGDVTNISGTQAGKRYKVRPYIPQDYDKPRKRGGRGKRA